MTWHCAAIDHGVAIFPNGKIGPCCQISADYLKPISELANADRFADLKTNTAPPACDTCNRNEHNRITSYRMMFNSRVTDQLGLQFVDIRNTNLCNLKCRYCGPHFSSRWAEELGNPVIQHQSIDAYKDILITDSLQWMYFTGGEPLINAEHWDLLQELIDCNKAPHISLLYNTNLTTIKYKNVDIIGLWKEFKSVKIQCSIDAIGTPLEYIRSGTDWFKIKSNLEQLSVVGNSITVVICPVISILNIWFIDELFEYANQHNFSVDPIVLTGPDYLALNVIPDQLKDLALAKIKSIRSYLGPIMSSRIKQLINNNINQCLIQQTISHVLLLDNNRNEKLFDLLPFKKLSQDLVLKNHEYE